MTEAASRGTPVLEGRGLTKRYGPVVALENVDFAVYPGEITALVGDNGAGKSTLVKILSGAVHADGGKIVHRQESVAFTSPHEARARGIETIYQDLALAQNRDVAANLFLGRELIFGGLLRPFAFLNRRAMVRVASKRLGELGITVPFVAGLPVARLSGGQRQAVAVARSAAWATDVLFMDEPTASLGVKQSKAVLELAKRIAGHGVSVVLITHVMPHVMEVADRLVVLRHGRKVADLPSQTVTTEELVSLIVGFDPGSEDGSGEAEDAQAGV
ncbi:MAG: sugar ABC transporter ATP-binding protein [Candidatus Rokuibacteriota bacterium]|nr:MAG: sugar ABC transporter ATP-binding protein [Candidatus Rokubacteria bacterium]